MHFFVEKFGHYAGYAFAFGETVVPMDAALLSYYFIMFQSIPRSDGR
jgi:hypothetical protein